MKPALYRPTMSMRASRGATLIELMVGLLVGLLVTLVVAQTMSFAEGYKRTTTGGADAQVNGSLALYTIQRDVQMSGYGMSLGAAALGCEIRAKFGNTNYTWSFEPLRITDGADGAPDEVSIMMSTKPYTVPVLVTEDHPRTAANFFVQSALGIAEGDLLIAVPATIDANNWCSLINATKDGGNGNQNTNGGGQGQQQVLHNAGNDGPWNQPGGQTVFPPNGYPAGSFLVNIGQMVNRTYSIQSQSLHLTTFNTSAPAAPSQDDLFPQIVNLQAMYGKDTDGNGVIDTWDNTTPVSNGAWQQLRAVRVAVVARSLKHEKEEVTASAPLWDVGSAIAVAGATDCGKSKCVPLKVDAVGADWKHYRYKVYDTVVPVRNVIWKS